jgi:hypothetical protein
LTSRVQSFETEMPTQEETLARLAALNRESIARTEVIDSPRRVVLDMDNTEDPGVRPAVAERLQRTFRVHLLSSLLLFNREGGCLAARLRLGNVHSAQGWVELLLPEIQRQQKQSKQVVFRADAAFAKPELYEALEERDVKYAIRLPSKDNLWRNIEPESGFEMEIPV